MNKLIPMAFVVFLIAISTAYAYSKGTTNFNVSYELITTPIAGVVYTPDSLGYHHLPINITYSGTLTPTALSLQTKNITWIKSTILGKDNLENVSINILTNETYADTTWIPNIKCNNTLVNVTNNTYKEECIDNGYYFNFTNWRYVWNPLTSLSIQKNKWFVIDLVGYSQPSLDLSAVDIVPNIYGFSMPELAWWNANYANCKNITLTETKGINRTFEPMKVNLTGLTKLANNNDVRIVNAACNADGTEQPRDVISSNSNWAYVIFLPNYTTTDSSHIYSVYYNYAGASAPSYSGSITLTGNTTEYNVTVTNQYKMMYESTFRDGGIKFVYYNGGTTLQQWGQFDDFNGATTPTLTTILNGSVMSSFNVNYLAVKNETYECYSNNFYCKIQYLLNPAANYFTVCPETSAAPIYWSAGAWAVGSVGNKNTIAIAWNNSNAKLVAQMNITGWTTEGCIRSDGSNWYTSTADLCTFVGNSSRAFYLLFNLPYASNSTFDKLLNPMTTALGAEQSSGGGGTSPTSIREWLNGVENNLTITYGTSLNVTAKINVTGLDVSILKNETVINTGTTSTTNITTWGSGYYNFTGNYSGNASYSASFQSYFLTVNPQPTSCSLSFSPTSNISFETQMKAICSCNNSIGTTNLYRNTTQINALNNTLVTYGAGTYVYVCNLTSTQNYSSATSGGTFIVSKLNAALQAYPNTNFNYTGINTNQYCTGSSTLSSVSFYRNSSSITNNTGFVLPARGWNYTCNLADSINYTNYYSINLFNVSKAAANASVNFNTSSPAVIGAVINVSCYIPEPPTSYPDGLWNLSTNISNPYIWNTAGYSAGTYPFKCNQSGSENYSAFSVNNSMQLVTSGSLYIVTYDEKTNASLTFNITVYNATFTDTQYNLGSYSSSSVSGDVTVVISKNGYIQRNYYLNIPPAGSTVLNAFLLDSSSGVYPTFWIYSASNPLGEFAAKLNVLRFLGTDYVLVAQQLSDVQGKGILYLDPYTTYEVNAESSDGSLTHNLSSYQANSAFILAINLGGVTSGVNITWLFSNTSYSLTPTDIYLMPNNVSNITLLNYTVLTGLSDISWYALRLIYWNGTILYLGNGTTSSGGSLTVNLNYNGLNGTVIAQTFLKKTGYNLFQFNRTYIVWRSSSAIPDILNEVKAAGLPNIVQSLIALFVAYGICMIVNRAWRTGTGIVFLGILTGFTLYGWFNLAFLVGLWMMEVGILLYREVY